MRLIDADELYRKPKSRGGESEKILISPDMPVAEQVDAQEVRGAHTMDCS